MTILTVTAARGTRKASKDKFNVTTRAGVTSVEVKQGTLKLKKDTYPVEFAVVSSRTNVTLPGTRTRGNTVTLSWVVLFYPSMSEPEEVYIMHQPRTSRPKLYQHSRNAWTDINLVLKGGQWFNSIFDPVEVPPNQKVKLRIPRKGKLIIRVDDSHAKGRSKRYKDRKSARRRY